MTTKPIPLPGNMQAAQELWDSTTEFDRITLLENLADASTMKDWWTGVNFLDTIRKAFEELPLVLAAELAVKIELGNPFLLPESPNIH